MVSVQHRGTGDTEVDLNTMTERINGAAIEVHKVLGPGLTASACEECLSSIEPIHEAQPLTYLKLGGSTRKSQRFARRGRHKTPHTSEDSVAFAPLRVLCASVVNGVPK